MPAEWAALKELTQVTRPDPSSQIRAGKARISDVDAATARRIFSGIRPPTLAQLPWSDNPSDAHHALPPVPALFTPSPLVVGQDAAKLFEQFSAINPEIRRTMRSITTGPNSSFIDWVLGSDDPRAVKFLGDNTESGLREENRHGHITRSSLKAQTPPGHAQYRDMYLNPYSDLDLSRSAYPPNLRDTMGHELGHALLGSSENWANKVEALLRQLPRGSGRIRGPRIEDVK
jgi:hypothetical protein